jgi:hypothetical protein
VIPYKLAAIAAARLIITSARPAGLVAVMVLAFSVLAGCGGDDDDGGAPPTAGVFVAKVEGTDAQIALVTDGASLGGGFLCVPEGASSWIRGAPLEDGTVELVARREESLGEATFDGDTASGEVTVAGGPQSFGAELAEGKAGLYRTTSGEPGKAGFSETGWVVLPDGSVCGVTGTTTSGGGFEAQPAPSNPKNQITDFANPFPF